MLNTNYASIYDRDYMSGEDRCARCFEVAAKPTMYLAKTPFLECIMSDHTRLGAAASLYATLCIDWTRKERAGREDDKGGEGDETCAYRASCTVPSIFMQGLLYDNGEKRQGVVGEGGRGNNHRFKLSAFQQLSRLTSLTQSLVRGREGGGRGKWATISTTIFR